MDIVVNDELNASDIRLYLYIKYRWQFFQQMGEDFYESQKTIGKTINMSERSVQYSMKNLQNKGYLEIVHRTGKSSLCIPFDASLKKKQKA